MNGWKRIAICVLTVAALIVAMGCDGVRFDFQRYPDTPVIIAPPAGLSSSELAAIIAAIR